MIPYEELERALARWKARHAAGAEAVAAAPAAEPVPQAPVDDDRTPMPPEHTGEIDLGDVIDES